MDNKNMGNRPPQLSPQDIARTIRSIASDKANKIMAVHVLVLNGMADQIEAGTKVLA